MPLAVSEGSDVAMPVGGGLCWRPGRRGGGGAGRCGRWGLCGGLRRRAGGCWRAGRVELVGPDIAAGGAASSAPVEGKLEIVLVGAAIGVAAVDRGAARQQRMGEGRAAVVLQRAEQRVHAGEVG